MKRDDMEVFACLTCSWNELDYLLHVESIKVETIGGLFPYLDLVVESYFYYKLKNIIAMSTSTL